MRGTSKCEVCINTAAHGSRREVLFFMYLIFSFFRSVTSVLLDAINAKMTDLVQVVLSRSPQLPPPGSYGISRRWAGALRGACSHVSAPANILIITGGSGDPAGCPCPLCGIFKGKKNKTFFQLAILFQSL